MTTQKTEYRPDGFDDIKTDWFFHSGRSGMMEGFIFEAGADAMLEGLKKEALYEVKGNGLSVLHGLIEIDYGKKGYLVFIEEVE